jgi:cellulose synthase/poly-beta-1,6-N-acetylglucosamine synthase-like glycosyltransferase
MSSELCKLDGQSPLHAGPPCDQGLDSAQAGMPRATVGNSDPASALFLGSEDQPKPADLAQKAQNTGLSGSGSQSKTTTSQRAGFAPHLVPPDGTRPGLFTPLDNGERPDHSGSPSQTAIPLPSRLHFPQIDLNETPPDPGLIANMDPQMGLKLCALPWRWIGDQLFVAVANRADAARAREVFHQVCGETDLMVRPVLAETLEIQAAIAHAHRAVLTDRAAARPPLRYSCRAWAQAPMRRVMMLGLLIGCFALALIAMPGAVMVALCLWSALTLIVATVLKTTAAVAYMRARPVTNAPPLPPLLPRMSIMVPLFRERSVAEILVKRLTQLDYPRDRLEILLVLEECDDLTRGVLEQADLPPWIRVVIVPDGQPRTKPRAMNYALDFCRGEIIGIYDAEDAPEPDQLLRVARRFAQADEGLVCLQGALDYYNPRQNWIARCFTIEYNTWFRLILPGMGRLGFALPLGGTTFFFRRQALEALGGWDAHNVTEDADLGFRLARQGYRSEILDTTTYEEANCRTLPWIKQRSRWLKGYLVTYLVHMRRPLTLLRDLGWRKFIGFQAHFVTALSQVTLAPFLWSFWAIPLGFDHPMARVVPGGWLWALGGLFLAAELVAITLGAMATRGPAHRHLWAYVPSMHIYWPLGFVAMIKALTELVFSPFYWDKTQHGLSNAQVAPDHDTSDSAPESSFNRVTKALEI